MADAKKYVEADASYKPQVEVKTIDGVRVVALTYVSPSGKPQFYAKKQTLGLDLRHPYFRTVEAYGDDGQMFEKIVIDSITPKFSTTKHSIRRIPTTSSETWAVSAKVRLFGRSASSSTPGTPHLSLYR